MDERKCLSLVNGAVRGLCPLLPGCWVSGTSFYQRIFPSIDPAQKHGTTSCTTLEMFQTVSMNHDIVAAALKLLIASESIISDTCVETTVTF